jgi:hypothetical protein
MLSHRVLQSQTAQPFRGADPHIYYLAYTFVLPLHGSTRRYYGCQRLMGHYWTISKLGRVSHAPLKGPNILFGPTLWSYVQCWRHMPCKHVHAALMDHYWTISKLDRVSHTPPERNRRPRRSNSIYGHTSSSGAICHAVYPICTHTCHALYTRTLTRI